MGLFRKLIQAYKDDKRETAKFLAQVKAAEERKAAEAAAPKRFCFYPPTKIGDATQAYRYVVTLSEPAIDVLESAISTEQYSLEVEQSDGVTYALFSGLRAGVISERYDMIADWLRRGDPLLLFLSGRTADQVYSLVLVFYKDKSAPHKWREQSSVSLIAYKSKSAQEVSAFLLSKEEVEIGEEYFGNDDDDCVVTYRGDKIGKVPAKIGLRISESGYSYAEIEDVLSESNDNGDDIYRPVIRIYW